MAAKKPPPAKPQPSPLSQRQRKRQLLTKARNAESSYRLKLRQVAKQVGVLVKGFAPKGKILDMPALQKALRDYAELITPWAKAVSAAMLADVNARTARSWRELSREMGQELGRELTTAPTGARTQELMEEQVTLIKSLPLQAAERVHDLAMQALLDGTRAEQVAKDIYATTTVTESRARLIARTEVARTASVLTQARAEYAGSEGYIWRTSGDADVRESHEEMEGKYVRWSEPPLLSDGTRTHAGQIYNCRCYSEPLFPDY